MKNENIIGGGKKKTSSELQGKYLTFKLAGESYGLPILKVQEIISMMNITKVPRTPDFVMGVINLRGKVIPIMNMRIKFGIEKADYTERTCIIVVKVSQSTGSVVLGVIVDEVSEVINLFEENIRETPSLGTAVNTAYIMGMGKLENDIVMLLDLDKAFSREEFESLSGAAM